MFEWRIHPEDAKLLRFCEGELTARETCRVERHVQTCWECRTHVDEIRKTIAEYVRYRKETLQPSLPTPPAPWRSLSGDLRRLRDEEANGPGLATLRRRLRVPWMFVSIAAIAASGAAVYFTRPNRPTPPIDPTIQAPKRPLPPEHRDVFKAQSKPVVKRTEDRPHIQSVGPDDELKAIAALHQIRADLGDPVYVVRKHDRIVVTGAGLEGKRAEEIRLSIAQLPNVVFELAPPTPSRAQPSSPVSEFGRSSPIQSEIAREFSNQASYQQFVDRVLDASEAVMARAHALHTLADHFPPDVEAQLSANGIELLASLRDQHAAALIDKVQEIDKSLSPVLESLGARAGPQEPVVPANWQRATYQLFTIAQRMDRLVGIMVAPSTSSSMTDSTPSEVAVALSQLEVGAQVYRGFSVDGKAKGGR